MNATMNEPRRHIGPPPGYLTRQGVAAALDVSSARRWGATGMRAVASAAAQDKS